MRAAALDPESADTYGLPLGSPWPRHGRLSGQHDEASPPRRHALSRCGGLSEIAWTGGNGSGTQQLAEAARAAGRALIDKYAASGSWPSGVATAGPNPSLMLGTAGIGMHFLRLHAAFDRFSRADRDRVKEFGAAMGGSQGTIPIFGS